MQQQRQQRAWDRHLQVVAHSLRQTTRQENQSTLGVDQRERFKLANSAPHNTHDVLAHKLVRADSCTDRDESVPLQRNPVPARPDGDVAHPVHI